MPAFVCEKFCTVFNVLRAFNTIHPAVFGVQPGGMECFCRDLALTVTGYFER